MSDRHSSWRPALGGLAWGWRRALGLLFFLLGAAGAVRAQSVLDWRWAHPLPHGNNIADAVVKDGTYVHVTDHGGIYMSLDRRVWIRRASGTMRDLRAAAFLEQRLLVTGEEGTVLWSDDGVTFEPGTLTPPTTNWLEAVAASADRAVAVGDRGTIYRSVDGQLWTPASTRFEDWLSGVAYGDGRFVAVGENGFVGTSVDGVYWTPGTSGTTTDLMRVAYGDGQFVAVGDRGLVLESADGIGWVPSPVPGLTNAFFTAAGAPGERLAGGDGALFLRKPPKSWLDQSDPKESPAPAPIWSYAAALWDGDRYLVGGRTGVLLEGHASTEPAFEGATSWSRIESSPRNWLWALERLDGVYFAVGDQGTLLSSSSGTDWTLESVPAEAVDGTLFGVGGSDALALAVGSDGVLLRSTGGSEDVVLTNHVTAAGHTNLLLTTNRLSLLGVNWERVSPSPTTVTLQGVGWNGSTFVVVGASGTVLTSPDTLQWSRKAIPGAGFLSSVTAFPGGWIASGAGGAIFTSPDAGAWTKRASGTTSWVYRVRSFGEQLAAVGENGVILTSTNGTSWVKRASGSTSWLTDICKVGSAFYVGGAQGTVLRSTNLVEWIVVETITGKALQGLSSHGAQLVAAGAEGVILRAIAEPAAQPVSIPLYRHFADSEPPVDCFVFEGTPELRFGLETTTSLDAWQPEPDLELDVNGRATMGRVADDARRFHRTITRP